MNPKVLFCEHNFENHAIIKKYIVGDRVQCYKREDFFSLFAIPFLFMEIRNYIILGNKDL